MVGFKEKIEAGVEFDPAPLRELQRLRSYSQMTEDGSKETWDQTCNRTLYSSHLGLKVLGKFTDEEIALIDKYQRNKKAFGSMRWLWVGGTKWVERPENYSGSFNCSSLEVKDIETFGMLMDLAAQGTGTGAVLTQNCISQLPPVVNQLKVEVVGNPGEVPADERIETTLCYELDGCAIQIVVGDSRQGWVAAYQKLIEIATDTDFGTTEPIKIVVDVSNVRPKGEKLKGFGGVANPVKLPGLFPRCAEILNGAVGRQLNSVECCLLIDEAASVIVAGSIRRCLPEDALVHTSKGLVPIKDVHVGDSVQTPVGFRRVVSKFDQGVQDVFVIESNSMPLRSTLNHRHAVMSDAKGGYRWTLASEIKEGDRLMHNTQVLPGDVTSLPPDFTQERPKNSRTAKSMHIPELTSDIAWLIGFTHGNGYVHVSRSKTNGKPSGFVLWATNALYGDLVDRIESKISIALEQFGLPVKKSVINGENTIRFQCGSIRFAEYFLKYIKQPKKSISIPDFILRGSIDIRAAYLAGLMDSDGSANNRPPHLVTTVYGDFARQVGAVLSSLGIAGRLTITVPKEANWSTKYNVTIPALKSRYNALIAPHSVKGALREGLKMYGFTVPGQMMRESYTYSEMRGMGLQGSVSVASNYERLTSESDLELDIPVTVKDIKFWDTVQTFDIEVEDAHCFYCDGYLTHNSAGQRQFDSSDELAANCKADLWVQDADGNWKIDPKRDSMRMANHTRVFPRKPTLQECVDAVTKMYWSGEGAIQYAPEAIARCNADLLDTPEKKKQFLSLSEESKHGWTIGRKGYLRALYFNAHGVEISEDELDHRMSRLGTNPCFRGDMKLLTVDGYKRFDEIEGTQPFIINAAGFISQSKVWCSGEKPVIELCLTNYKKIACTPDHLFLTQSGEKPASECKGEKLTPFLKIPYHDPEYVILGFIQGDGQTGRLKSNSHLGVDVNIGKDDQDILDLIDFAGYEYEWWSDKRRIYLKGVSMKMRELGFSPENMPKRGLPSSYTEWSIQEKSAFLNGLYSANGSVVGDGRITLKTSCPELRDQVLQSLKDDFGIEGYFTTNKAKAIEFSNGVYQCRESYDVNIGKFEQKVHFFNTIGYSIGYKNEKLAEALFDHAPAVRSIVDAGVEKVYDFTEPEIHWGIVEGFVAHNCGEALGTDFHCTLGTVHLNTLDPFNLEEQKEAFRAAALQTAAMLQRGFVHPRLQKSREYDPQVLVSFTGAFTFFIKAFGSNWLKWWEAGRPDVWDVDHDGGDMSNFYRTAERDYLTHWRKTVEQTVWEYCDRHGLKRPNRCTGIKPEGSGTLLTGVGCNGFHPPKGWYYIRRMTFAKDDPIALAAMDYGYSVVPSQSDKDENGYLLNDPFSPLCTEWLVEVPVKEEAVHLFPEIEDINPGKFSALAQMDFYMQIQTIYTTFNTSATIEFTEDEIEPLAERIHSAIQNDEGYISAALLARFDSNETFPRLPFEPISKQRYEELTAEVLQRRKSDDFQSLIDKYMAGHQDQGPQDSACDGGACEFRIAEPSNLPSYYEVVDESLEDE